MKMKSAGTAIDAKMGFLKYQVHGCFSHSLIQLQYHSIRASVASFNRI